MQVGALSAQMQSFGEQTVLGATSMVDGGAVLALRGGAGSPVLAILSPRNTVRSSTQLDWLNHTAGMVVITGHEVLVLLCPLSTHNAAVHVVSFSGASFPM